MSTSNNNNAGQLFDLKQRANGDWIVWTRKSRAELGLIDRATVEATRGAEFTDEGWAEFVQQPQFVEASVWVIAQVYKDKPTVETVLNLLGVKRKPRPEGAPRKDSRPQRRQQRAPAPADSMVAA